MTEVVVVAYIPVLHEGYRRFLLRHAVARRVFVIGPELTAGYRPLAKDVRALDAALVASSLAAWGIASAVRVLDEEAAGHLAAQDVELILPDEDISRQVAERFFARRPWRLDSAFLRWDKQGMVRMLEPRPARVVTSDQALADLAEAEGARSLDWWRQVGAAIRFADGTLEGAHNGHLPHDLAHYEVGDPRSNFFKGVHFELTTAEHAEARLVAAAARSGRATEGAVMYVTDFPCPTCAKLVASAGITRLYYRTGYAMLDGQAVLEAAGVELVSVV